MAGYCGCNPPNYPGYYSNYPSFNYPMAQTGYMGAPYMQTPYYFDYWWGAPTGWTDLDLYDYNNNYILDDNEIEDIIRDNISLDYGIPFADENRIDVSVQNGIATLSGEVINPRSKPLAYADAFWSSGVVDVVNNINVRPRARKEEGAEEEQEPQVRQTQRQGSQQETGMRRESGTRQPGGQGMGRQEGGEWQEPESRQQGRSRQSYQ